MKEIPLDKKNSTPRPRNFFSLLRLFLVECLNPERHGFPLGLQPNDIPVWFRENRYWGRKPDPFPPPKPWLNYDLVRWMEQRKPQAVLEWGSGSSTLWMSGFCRKLVSVEHDLQWQKTILRCLRERDRQVDIHHYTTKEEYVGVIRKFGSPRPNLILVDGKWREECLVASLPDLDQGCEVILHDSNTLEHLHVLRRLGNKYTRIDRYGPCHGIKNFRGWTLLRKK